MTNCSDGGVVGVVPGIIGSLQAQEAMKIIGEFGQVLSGKLLLYDGLSCRFTSVKLRPRSEKAALIEKLIDYEQFCGAKATDKGGLISAESFSIFQKMCQSTKGQEVSIIIFLGFKAPKKKMIFKKNNNID